MSVNQQQEPSEDDLAPSFSYKQHLTPPVSSSFSSTLPSQQHQQQQQRQQQPPEHDFRHMKLTPSHESGKIKLKAKIFLHSSSHFSIKGFLLSSHGLKVATTSMLLEPSMAGNKRSSLSKGW
jgi:hypothetical protein